MWNKKSLFQFRKLERYSKTYYPDVLYFLLIILHWNFLGFIYTLFFNLTVPSFWSSNIEIDINYIFEKSPKLSFEKWQEVGISFKILLKIQYKVFKITFLSTRRWCYSHDILHCIKCFPTYGFEYRNSNYTIIRHNACFRKFDRSYATYICKNPSVWKLTICKNLFFWKLINKNVI